MTVLSPRTRASDPSISRSDDTLDIDIICAVRQVDSACICTSRRHGSNPNPPNPLLLVLRVVVVVVVPPVGAGVPVPPVSPPVVVPPAGGAVGAGVVGVVPLLIGGNESALAVIEPDPLQVRSLTLRSAIMFALVMSRASVRLPKSNVVRALLRPATRDIASRTRLCAHVNPTFAPTGSNIKADRSANVS
jgi:hypothetical protein